MKLHIAHRTTYSYAAPAGYSIQLLRLTPRRDATQRPLQWRLRMPGRRVEQLDAFGNQTQLVTLEGPHIELTIEAEGVVETQEGMAGVFAHDGALSPLAYVGSTALTRSSPVLDDLARSVFDEGVATRERIEALMEMVTQRVRYRPGATQVTDSAADALTRGEGVCQDQAHVAVALCRAAGIPARYVSGYIFDSAAARSASHAWVDIWLDAGQHWLSCDITHRALAGATLCRLACGRDYLDAAPVRGVRRGGGHEQLDVSVQVTDASQQ